MRVPSTLSNENTCAHKRLTAHASQPLLAAHVCPPHICRGQERISFEKVWCPPPARPRLLPHNFIWFFLFYFYSGQKHAANPIDAAFRRSQEYFFSFFSFRRCSNWIIFYLFLYFQCRTRPKANTSSTYPQCPKIVGVRCDHRLNSVPLPQINMPPSSFRTQPNHYVEYPPSHFSSCLKILLREIGLTCCTSYFVYPHFWLAGGIFDLRPPIPPHTPQQSTGDVEAMPF